MRRLAPLATFALLALAAALVGGCSDDVTQPAQDDPWEFIATDKDVERPFSDYVEAQGTYCWPDGEGGCIDFEPPMLNFIGWTDPDLPFNCLFEYLGNAAPYLYEESDGAIDLGTEITGRVLERELEDGRALIRINVIAHDILGWVTQIEDFYLDPIVFGARPDEVLAGMPPAIGEFRMRAMFTLPEPGLPLPDLFQLVLVPEEGQQLIQLSAEMWADGVFREGSGFAPGTLGSVHTEEVFQLPPDGGYGWFIERIEFTAPDDLTGGPSY